MHYFNRLKGLDEERDDGHLLALDDNTPLNAFPEIETAAREYGFAQNLDSRTKMELLKFYKELLAKDDALEVYEVRSSGKLLEYAGRDLCDKH